MLKKSLSVIITLCMILSSFAITGTAFAAEADISQTGDGDFTEIKTVEDLYMINTDLAGNYKLMNDIDLTEATAEGGDWDFGGRGWEPIGSNGTYSGATPFTGTFDGNGYEIKGLRINVNSLPNGTGDVYIGLFANNSGTIKNLAVSGTISASVASNYVGTITGYNQGVIENCKNVASINTTNTYYVGGISGFANKNSWITKCKNSATINVLRDDKPTDMGYNAVYSGGMSGYSIGSITECYNNGDIDSTMVSSYYYAYSSGIACVQAGKIEDCYNTGKISALADSGIRVGGISSGKYGTISNCYNTGSATQAISYGTVTNCYFLSGSGADTTGAKSLTAAQMKLKALFNGFDFDNVWFIEKDSDYPYPQLRNNPFLIQTSIADMDITLDHTSYVYDGTAKEPVVTVKDGEKVLTKDTDYTVSYSDNINHGTGKVTITGANDYLGTAVREFSIEKCPITETTIFLDKETFDYDGSAHMPNVVIMHGTKMLAVDTDYEIGCDDAVNVGTVTITVTGKGNYDKTATKTFTIQPKSIAGAAITVEPDEFTYDGTAKQPTVTVYDGEKLLTVDVDYTVDYENNTEVGEGKVIIKGIGNYSNSAEASFEIKSGESKIILGDADSDGKVTILDATCIQRHLASLPTTAYNEKAADADGDGKVTILDATAIQRHLASLPTHPGIGEPV